METNTTAKSINDQLKHCTCTDHHYKVWGKYLCTDGIKELAELGECFWLISDIAIIADFIRRKYHQEELDFMVFTLKRMQNDQFKLLIGNGDEVIETRPIPFSDFAYDLATIWLEGDVMLLPSEH